MAKKLNLVDMYGIGLMLEHLVAEGNITCEERDRVILRIARENDIAEYMLSNLAGYGRSKQEVLERAKRRKGLESQGKKQEEGYISLTEVARAHSEDAPGYVIQSWLRSGNTLAFLNLWEQENNPNYSETGYAELLKRKKTASFTLTPKLWIDQTKAIGIVSKQEVLERAKRRKGLESQGKKQEEGYISLTEVARAHSEDAPGYVIQSWLRSGNTLAFLNLWEQENNPNYSETGYAELLKRKKTASFTLTPKLWIDQTKAIGIVSKQGKNGGTFAHPMIACEFASWIAPEFKMQLLKLSLDRTKLR